MREVCRPVGLHGRVQKKMIVMNQALLESLVYVGKEDLYELPLLAVLHCVPQRSRNSTVARSSKHLLM